MIILILIIQAFTILLIIERTKVKPNRIERLKARLKQLSREERDIEFVIDDDAKESLYSCLNFAFTNIKNSKYASLIDIESKVNSVMKEWELDKPTKVGKL